MSNRIIFMRSYQINVLFFCFSAQFKFAFQATSICFQYGFKKEKDKEFNEDNLEKIIIHEKTIWNDMAFKVSLYISNDINFFSTIFS